MHDDDDDEITIVPCFCRSSAKQIDSKVQRGLFIFAVANSCLDPIVYGKYSPPDINFLYFHFAFFQGKLPSHKKLTLILKTYKLKKKLVSY